MLLKLPTWLRAAIITSAQAFVGTVLALFLAVIPDLLGWVNGGAIPDLATYGKLLAGAAAAFVTGVLTAIYRKVKPVEQSYPERLVTGTGTLEVSVKLDDDQRREIMAAAADAQEHVERFAAALPPVPAFDAGVPAENRDAYLRGYRALREDRDEHFDRGVDALRLVLGAPPLERR